MACLTAGIPSPARQAWQFRHLPRVIL
ncbi:hypothetical protein BDI4_210177 [Burkholderia diffusa]|nr:hypothetical protein BDI4_210177 [Burkholderia diffusa]